MIIGRDYLFGEKELDVIKFLSENSPNKIWSDPITYVFEYSEFYLRIEVACKEKFTLEKDQNSFPEASGSLEQYVMAIELSRVDDLYIPNEASELIGENEEIISVEIVRSSLYFCYHEKNTSNTNFYLLRSDQLNLHSKLPTELDIQKVNKVDVGLFIVAKNQIYNCFIIENEDDFESNSFFYRNKNLKKLMGKKYSFIRI